jgi:hypothetical protein
MTAGGIIVASMGLNNAVTIQLLRRFCKVLHILEQGAILGVIETHIRSDVRKAVGKPDNLVPSALVFDTAQGRTYEHRDDLRPVLQLCKSLSNRA